jgi:carbon storage regulator
MRVKTFKKRKQMLVLSRQRNDSIVIVLNDGRIIKINVVDIRGDKVRIGIDADKTIGVYREELYKRLLTEREPIPNIPMPELPKPPPNIIIDEKDQQKTKAES